MSEIEPFVDADRAAQFLSVTRRRAIELARAGQIPAHPIGGGKRRIWRFRLSEVAASIAEKNGSYRPQKRTIDTGSPRQPNRRN